MKKRLFVLLSFVALGLPTTGCRSMFPTDDTRTKSTWQNFDEAQVAYDKIIPHKTTVADLKEMGFDCHKTANIRILTYLDLIQRFIPNASINKDDLQEDVRRCLEAKDCCQAYELNLDVTNRKRYGNLFLDLFGFKRVTKVTGWNFQALDTPCCS